MVDIIYKTVNSSCLQKLQIVQNINNLMFQVIFIFSDRILIKQFKFSSTPFCCWGKEIFKKALSGVMKISVYLGCYDKNLGASFEWGGGGMSKNA